MTKEIKEYTLLKINENTKNIGSILINNNNKFQHGIIDKPLIENIEDINNIEKFLIEIKNFIEEK